MRLYQLCSNNLSSITHFSSFRNFSSIMIMEKILSGLAQNEFTVGIDLIERLHFMYLYIENGQRKIISGDETSILGIPISSIRM